MTISAFSFVKMILANNAVTKGMGAGANMMGCLTECCYIITGIVNKMLGSIKINKKCFDKLLKWKFGRKLNETYLCVEPESSDPEEEGAFSFFSACTK